MSQTNRVWSVTYLVLLILLATFLLVSLRLSQPFDSYENLPAKLRLQLIESAKHIEQRSIQD